MSVPLAAAAVLLAASLAPPTPVVLPGGPGAIGLDDLRFSEELRALIVPAGRTGRLDLVDPGTGAIASIAGFGASSSPSRGHEVGTTSADAGEGWMFAIDRTDATLSAVDPRARRIVARTSLGGAPDYVRWVGGAAQEVWVTEPERNAIELFGLEGGTRPRLTRAGTISVPGGPESLAVDANAHRAYTNTFHDETVAIDVDSHAIAARWRNGCRGARGIALDPARGLLFVGCAEGKVVSLDVAHGGTRTGRATAGAGVDGIAYSPRLGHLYVPAADAARLTVLEVRGRGRLEVRGTVPLPRGAHCAAAGDRADVYVCDPANGRLLVFSDVLRPAP